MLCCHDYSKRVVAIFAHQIQSEYYGGNRYVFIEGISLEHFSAPVHPEAATTPQACTLNAAFHSF